MVSTPGTNSLSRDLNQIAFGAEHFTNMSGGQSSKMSRPDLMAMNSEMMHFQVIVQHLHTYVLPIVIIIGLAGNSTSFIVFICTHLKRTSCNIYLAALAVSDSAFLVCVLLSWGMDIYNQEGWCQTLVYVTYVTSFLSVWYVVAFTVERFILVCFPGYKPVICRAKTAKNVVISLAIFAISAYMFSPFMSGVVHLPHQSLCAPLPGYSASAWVINNIDTFVTLIIPTIIILGCNMRIAYLVCTFYNNKDDMAVQIWKWEFTSDSQRASHQFSCAKRTSYINGAKFSSKKAKPNYQMRATQMLLIVSTVFLICNIPSHVVRAFAFVKTMLEHDYVPTRSFFVWQKFFQIIFYMNFSVNVFLYSFSSRSFRLGFRRLMQKIGRRIQDLIKRKRFNLSPQMEYRFPPQRSDDSIHKVIR